MHLRAPKGRGPALARSAWSQRDAMPMAWAKPTEGSPWRVTRSQQTGAGDELVKHRMGETQLNKCFITSRSDFFFAILTPRPFCPCRSAPVCSSVESITYSLPHRVSPRLLTPSPKRGSRPRTFKMFDSGPALISSLVRA